MFPDSLSCEISEELINGFSETQVSLHNEVGINQIETSYREKEYNFLENKFLY